MKPELWFCPHVFEIPNFALYFWRYVVPFNCVRSGTHLKLLTKAVKRLSTRFRNRTLTLRRSWCRCCCYWLWWWCCCCCGCSGSASPMVKGFYYTRFEKSLSSIGTRDFLLGKHSRLERIIISRYRHQHQRIFELEPIQSNLLVTVRIFPLLVSQQSHDEPF